MSYTYNFDLSITSAESLDQGVMASGDQLVRKLLAQAKAKVEGKGGEDVLKSKEGVKSLESKVKGGEKRKRKHKESRRRCKRVRKEGEGTELTNEELTAAVVVDYLNNVSPALARDVQKRFKVLETCSDEQIRILGETGLQADMVMKGREEVIVLDEVMRKQTEEVMVLEEREEFEVLEEREEVEVLEKREEVKVLEEREEVDVLSKGEEVDVLAKEEGVVKEDEDSSQDPEEVTVLKVVKQSVQEVKKNYDSVGPAKGAEREVKMAKQSRKEVVLEKVMKEDMEVVVMKERMGDSKSEVRSERLATAVALAHMGKVAPELARELARELKKQFKVPEVCVTLEEMVKVYKQKEGKGKRSDNEATLKRTVKNRVTGVKKKRFTQDEDEFIKEAIDEGKVNITTISKHLNRNSGSVHNRIELLKRSDDSISRWTGFDLTEDLAILETLVLPRLQKDKLSNIYFHRQDYGVRELTQQLKRGSLDTLTKRWVGMLQPTLLQHYSGTLNLRVERMLANHIVESYRDYSDIRWEEVAARREFAGHTIISLKNIYLTNLRANTGLKFSINSSEVSLKDITLYSEEVYGKGKLSQALPSKVKLQRQKEVIAFVEGKVEELGIKDFL